MRYQMLLFMAILLIGTPWQVWSQEVSPVVVEMQRDSTSPTTIRTGEPFVQIYKISYIRSEKWGKEVVILEDTMRPKTFPVSLGDFEIVGWALDEPTIIRGEETDELVRYLRLNLRIINLKKGAYKVPKISINWVLKMGETIENQKPIETEEVYLNYLTTVTQDPYLDIREQTNFGDYSQTAHIFWWVSRVSAPLGALTLLFFLMRSWWSIKRRKIERSTKKVTDENCQESVVVSKPVFFHQAYREFFRQVSHSEISCLEFEKKIVPLLYKILRARLGKLHPGDTAVEMRLYIEKTIKTGRYKKALLFLQDRLAAYEKDIQLGHAKAFAINDLAEEIRRLKRAVGWLKLRWRFLAFGRRRHELV